MLRLVKWGSKREGGARRDREGKCQKETCANYSKDVDDRQLVEREGLDH